MAFEDKKENLVNKPQKGVFDKAGVKPKRYLKEFKYSDTYEVGAEIKCDMFAAGDIVCTGENGFMAGLAFPAN